MHVDIKKLPQALQGCRQFSLLYNLCRDHDAYLVGGAVRDALIGLPVADLDLIFPDDPTPLAQRFAKLAGGSWFWLDSERRQSRVVVNQGANPYFDFAPFRAPDLESDLQDRDFTINAMAVRLSGYLEPTLIDPFAGLQALRENTLSMVSELSFSNDPLRIVKGLRHATTLGLNIETVTLHAMRHNASALKKVAPERVRQEVWKILDDEDVGRGLSLLNECQAGEALFSGNFALSLRNMIASLPKYNERWTLLKNKSRPVCSWFDQEVEQGLSRKVLLLFVLLFHQLESRLPEQIAEKWLLSRKAKSNIKALVSLDKATARQFASIARNQRALHWWSLRCGVEPKLLLLYLAVYDLQDEDLLTDLASWVPIAEQLEDQRLPDLVYGRWLTESLGIEEGPEMSRALELLRNAEITGEVSNAEEARHFLSQLYLDND